jgi:adenosylcobyric acid synthase
MNAKTLMIVGTMSSAGKSLLVTGLCRIYARRGIRVAPFKAQNMSNNAAVCADGSEIGRAQYTQALACSIAPTVEMNPILLKPEADSRSQIVLMGKSLETLPAKKYYKRKEMLWEIITQALDSLRQQYELVIIEGAGSPVELNLKRGDLVNMAVAKYAQSPTLLVGDVDRGGIFAQLLGTLWLLEEAERRLLKGLIINKFRGDIELFYDGVNIIEEKGGVPVVGVVPYTHHYIPEEDAVAIEAQNFEAKGTGGTDIVVVRLPRISNFDDFLALDAEEGVNVRYIDSPGELGAPHAVILPGSKSTIADLEWLRRQGLDTAIQTYANYGGVVVGICGGYQMLGMVIRDPHRTESNLDQMDGLGLLPVETDFFTEKTTHQAEAIVRSKVGWLKEVTDSQVSGYEIHMGVTQQVESAWLEITQRSGETLSVPDGSIRPDGKIWGCYLHGIFDNHDFRRAWLKSLGWGGSTVPIATIETALDNFADVLEDALDMDYIDQLLGLKT